MENSQENKKKIKEQYIGEVYAQDLYAFCNMKEKKYFEPDTPYYEKENGIVVALRRQVQEDGSTPFWLEAALGGSLWYVYRGMIWFAILLDAIFLTIFQLAGVTWWGRFAVSIVFMIVCGYMAIPKYYNHIHACMKRRKLLMRSAVESENLKESLKKEGKTSIKSVIFYVIMRHIIIQCVEGIVFTIRILMETQGA